MMKKKSIFPATRNNVFYYYIYEIFARISLGESIWLLLYLQRSFSLSQVMIWGSIYLCAQTIFELPSGILADKWGRKNTLLLSAALKITCILMVTFLGWSFAMISLIWFMKGVNEALNSDTGSSLLYDSLPNNKKRSQTYAKIKARTNIIGLCVLGISAILGGALTNYLDYSTIYLISAIPTVMTMITCLKFKEPKKYSIEESSLKGAKTLLGESINIVKCSGFLKSLIIYSAIIAMINAFIWEYYQAFIQLVGIPVYYFGFITLALSVVESVPQLFSYHFIRKNKFDNYFAISITLIASIVIAVSYLPNMIGLILMLIAVLISGLSFPVTEAYLHKAASLRCRTTVQSIQSFVSSVVYIFTLLLISTAISQSDNILIALRVIGIISISYAVYFVTKNRKEIFYDN